MLRPPSACLFLCISLSGLPEQWGNEFFVNPVPNGTHGLDDGLHLGEETSSFRLGEDSEATQNLESPFRRVVPASSLVDEKLGPELLGKDYCLAFAKVEVRRKAGERRSIGDRLAVDPCTPFHFSRSGPSLPLDDKIIIHCLRDDKLSDDLLE